MSLAPLVLASDGIVYVNVAMPEDSWDPKKVIERGLAEGGEVFVGGALGPTETEMVLARLDNAAAEIVARVLGARQRRRREVARRIRRTPSRTSSGAPSKRRPAS